MRAQVYAVIDAGWTQKEIAEYLKILQATISKTLKKIKETIILGHAKDNERPRKIFPAISSIIFKKMIKKPTISLRKISKTLQNDHKIDLSHVTLWII